MKVNRPWVVGKFTKDVVYARLAPGVSEELERRNPISEGARKARHHQWLTEDLGVPALNQHLHTVMALMRVSDSWEVFKEMLDKALPRRGDTLQMDLYTGMEKER